MHEYVNGWGLKLVTGPSVEPVTVEEVKALARIQHTADDSVIEGLIPAARIQAEHLMRRQLVNATWRLTLDWFPSWEIKFPRPPLASITSIKYDDVDGNEQTLTVDDDYRVLTDDEPGRVEPSYDAGLWPVTFDRAGAVRIVYVAGYGATAASVPADIRHAIKWLVCWWLETRELAEIPNAFKVMLEPYEHGEHFVGVYDE